MKRFILFVMLVLATLSALVACSPPEVRPPRPNFKACPKCGEPKTYHIISLSGPHPVGYPNRRCGKCDNAWFCGNCDY